MVSAGSPRVLNRVGVGYRLKLKGFANLTA